MRGDKLKVVATPADPPESGRYLLDEQVGFLMRVAMQRHTSIFTSRMVEALTQTQFAALVCDRAYVLEKGQIRWHGRMAELAGDVAVQRRLLSV